VSGRPRVSPARSRLSGRLVRQAVLLAVGVVVGAVLFRGENFLERALVDLRFFIISSFHVRPTVSDRVAVVAMDNRSEEVLKVHYGTRWRQFHPVLIRTLNAAGASLVVFDATFLDEEPSWDPALAEAVRAAGNVIAGEDEPGSTVPALRSAFRAVGDLRWKAMGGIPRYLRVSAQAAALRPLSLVAAEQDAALRGGAPPDPRFRRPPGFWINFRWEPDHFFSFSYADVLRASDGRIADSGRTALSVFADRIVLVGLDDRTSQADRFAFPNTMLSQYPGVFGQASAVETILRGAAVTRAPPWVDGLLTAGFLVLALLALEIRARKARALLLVLLPVGYFGAATAALSASNAWLGCAPVLMGFAAVLLLHWVDQRMTLASRLSRAMGFDPRLMDAFREESTRSGGPVRREVAILIADVRGYTAYVSGTDSAVVSAVMTEYMAAMERCITAEGGYINKYVGDEIVSVFGFPLAAEGAAERAVRAGIAMLLELDGLVAVWKERGTACIERIGIGIDAGPVVFAEIGGRTKSQFDIIGDCINGASRIEQLTKQLKQSMLLSEEVYRAVEGNDSLSGSFGFVKTAAVRGQGRRRVYGRVR
jgi:class 3 adenylate cyclase/CHASE2 domain-containing sensor protein